MKPSSRVLWILLPALLLGPLSTTTPAEARPQSQPPLQFESAQSEPAQSDSAPRLRIGVEQDGIHRITGQDLERAGLDPAQLDPRNLALYRGDQPAGLWRPGAEDGRWDAGDALYFYGRALRTTPGQIDFYGAQLPVVLGERLYTDEQAYWLVLEDGPQADLERRDVAPIADAPLVDRYRHPLRLEDHRWFYSQHFTNDDPWLWYRIQPGPVAAVTETFAVGLDAPAAEGAPAELRVELLAASDAAGTEPDHHVRLRWASSGRQIAESLWDGPTRQRLTASLPAGELAEGQNELQLQVLMDQGLRIEDLYLDWIELDYDRRLEPIEGRLDFALPAAEASRYRLTGSADPELLLWDVTDPLQPVVLQGARPLAAGEGGPALEWSLPAGGARHLTAALPEAALSPSSIRRVEPDGLESITGADYIVISPDALKEGSRQLAALRAEQGLRTAVVDVDDLFNRFNEGVYHPRAIQRFLRWARERWEAPAPRYLVLIGDGHWNFHGYNPDHIQNGPILMPPNLAWVDPYQGLVDSANRLALLDDEDRLPDLEVGRIPVRSEAELAGVVDKIRRYESQAPADWMQRHIFSLDDTPDPAGDFKGITEALLADSLAPGSQPIRRYLDDYPDANSLKDQLLADLNGQSAVMLHYFGHGARERWAHEGILRLGDLPGLRNADRLPIVFSWTCLDGTWDFPNGEGMAESLLRMEGGGAIASFSSTGLGVATGHDLMQRAVYEAYFAGAERLGDLTRAARVALDRRGTHHDLIDTYTLFGDPALRLPDPEGRAPRLDARLLLPYLLRP